MAIINPYAHIDWSIVKYLKSNSHLHCRNQEAFMKAYRLGQRHFPVVHYQPSTPTYPLSDWLTEIPENVIGSPNSEKVNTSNDGGHFNSLGSFYESQGHYWEEDVPKLTWQNKFDGIVGNLQFEDGGGITLNHPDDLNLDRIISMLNYDDRVLGIEIYNDSCDWFVTQGFYDGYSKDKYIPFWDKILSKGVRCWGFAVIDWFAPEEKNWVDKGWSKLLVNDITEHDALKAYRDGSFFGVILDTGLIFTDITLNGKQLTVSTNKSRKIKLITDKEKIEVLGNTNTFQLRGDEIYARIEAEDTECGYIYSNPIMFNNQEDLIVGELA